MGIKIKSSFTILEILIVIALIALLGTALLVLFNPKLQIDRSRDAQRKRDLDKMRKVFEEFYNDKGCYPKPVQVCYANTSLGVIGTNTSCLICGHKSTPDDIKSYVDPLPCDPVHQQKDYMYQVDNINCPTWFRLYANFDASNDPASLETGCGEGGCGITPNWGYDFGVASPNYNLNVVSSFYCYQISDKRCGNCGTYLQCINRTNCETIYASSSLCCDHVPNPVNCPPP